MCLRIPIILLSPWRFAFLAALRIVRQFVHWLSASTDVNTFFECTFTLLKQFFLSCVFPQNAEHNSVSNERVNHAGFQNCKSALNFVKLWYKQQFPRSAPDFYYCTCSVQISRLSALPMVNSSNFSITIYIYGRTRPRTKNHCTLWVRPVRCNIRKGPLYSLQAAFLSLWFFELWFTLPPCMGAIEYDLTKKNFTLVVALKKNQGFLPFFQTLSPFSRLFPGLENCWQISRLFQEFQTLYEPCV